MKAFDLRQLHKPKERLVTDTPRQMALRKNDHIRICRDEGVEGASKHTSKVDLRPCAFPEMDVSDVDLSASLLGTRFSMPLLITGMTGGVEFGQQINEVLAKCAEKYGIPMGLGSQKMMLANPETAALFQVRSKAPNAFLIGNIGAVSLNYGVTTDDIVRLVDSCELNAFAIHINALQECIQPEGERNFKNLFFAIENVVKRLPVPVVVKEVGVGLDARSAVRLAEMGVRAIDVGGQGGTSWSYIEGRRGDGLTQRLGTLFRDWGTGTEQALINCVDALKQNHLKPDLIATGGVRDGIHVAKLVGLGAQMAGVGLPLFRAATDAIQQNNVEKAIADVESEIEFFKRSLTIAMFCSGAKTLGNLASCIERKE